MQLGNKNVKTLEKKNWCCRTGVVEWKRQKDGRSSSSYDGRASINNVFYKKSMHIAFMYVLKMTEETFQ